MGKLDDLRQSLQNENVDAILITNGKNRRYLTGFTGTSGVVLVTHEQALFITDFRYIEQANEQIEGFDIIEHKQSIVKEVAEQLSNRNISKVGFEKDDLTYAIFEQYKEAVNGAFIPVSGIVERLRLIKSDDELQILKDAAQIADKAFKHILTFIKPGVKEIDVSNELEFFMRKEGATSSSFDIIVASGVRSALPHGVASTKVIEAGELVTLDFGALYKGYCSDITRTVAVGEISKELKTIYDTVLEAQKRGMDGIKAGITGADADALTRDYIKEKGYGDFFGHSTGHGIGLDVHEGPGLSFRTNKPLEPGMVVTVEPGIYVPNVGGCRIEDDTIVTKDGNERITHSPKELITL
ncbi:Xaa-Pro peptidase family protein [Aquibacillus sp. 3ASR75-11]|uniref:Xaa-Pro peptidase family protein n=1 Tax=Terrihalobacillus insolitus TaxID=2950438 RepID=A0A9X3WT97_9BACI|nr:Xaa-Pro peptidase family protein [Terrihalobacillus insolitus]MDC3414420.1 Xaa-Pro peptidase family protein [Terrihalobacillus insolitus]MDC3425300.1 Xaa-Pro peptidase family protein [Terrihalobacillus insolitus]